MVEKETKVCSRCGEDKPASQYQKHHVDKYGVQRYRADCNACVAKVARIKKLVPTDGYKYCTNCGEEKHLSEFSKPTDKNPGIISWCRCCKDERQESKYPNGMKYCKCCDTTKPLE